MTDTVIVALKLPHGLNIGGGVTLNGVPPILPGQPRPIRPGGYALTVGVPVVVWDAWRAANADSELVRRKLIFAASSSETVRAFTKANGGTRSGMEQRK